MQEAPFCVQVELTEGCNLRCNFCGLQGIREEGHKDYKFLTCEMAMHIAALIKKAGWNPRIEFAMHGEPTMNPNHADIVAIFRNKLPKHHLMMTSNGGGLLKDPTAMIDALMNAGLNVLALDSYEYVNIVPKIREKYDGEYWIYDYPKESHMNPHRRRRPNDHEIVIVQDISVAHDGVHATLNNHAGSAFPKNDKARGARCAKPFRELSIRWDGSVAICCNDWRGEYAIGRMDTVSDIESIWQSELFDAARRYLYHGMREFAPCAGCDALSYRVGLLPDKLGQEEVDKPTAEDLVLVRQAQADGPLTAPVKRNYELTVEGRKT